MTTYTTTIETPWSSEDAFEYMATFSNAREWDPSVVEARVLTPGPPRPGAVYRVGVEIGGRVVRLDYEVLALDRPSRVVLRAIHRFFTSTDTITVEPAGTGAVVRYVAALDLRGLLRPFNPVLSPLVARRFGSLADRAAARLRVVLA